MVALVVGAGACGCVAGVAGVVVVVAWHFGWWFETSGSVVGWGCLVGLWVLWRRLKGGRCTGGVDIISLPSRRLFGGSKLEGAIEQPTSTTGRAVTVCIWIGAYCRAS